MVGIDTVIYFTVTDPRAATYEVANPLQAIEQLTVTTLAQRDRRHDARGDADLARQHQQPAARRARRGDRPLGHPRQPRRAEVGRAAAHRPGGDGEADARRARPPRDDPHRRGLNARPRSSRPRARSSRPCCAPRASAPSAILKAEGEAKAIETVFGAIHDGAPDQALLSYQYLQMLPAARAGRREQGLRDPVRVLLGAVEPDRRASPTASRPPAKPKPRAASDRDETDARAAADAEEAAARRPRRRRAGRERGHARRPAGAARDPAAAARTPRRARRGATRRRLRRRSSPSP